MSRAFAALAFDMDAFDDMDAPAAEAALVRGRDGRLRPVDVARLAWPDERASAGVDLMADLMGPAARSRC